MKTRAGAELRTSAAIPRTRCGINIVGGPKRIFIGGLSVQP